MGMDFEEKLGELVDEALRSGTDIDEVRNVLTDMVRAVKAMKAEADATRDDHDGDDWT